MAQLFDSGYMIIRNFISNPEKIENSFTAKDARKLMNKAIEGDKKIERRRAEKQYQRIITLVKIAAKCGDGSRYISSVSEEIYEDCFNKLTKDGFKIEAISEDRQEEKFILEYKISW